MRRFVTLAVLIFCSLPFGVSISGCHHATPPVYCNGQNSGVVVGQLTTLLLQPQLTGISLNEGEISQVNAPTGTDCKGNSASATGTVYGSSNLSLVDIAPTTGRLCAGTWNRNSGGGIADFTFCTASPVSGIAYVTASAAGVSSNSIPVYIHPIVTRIVLGLGSTNCSLDPASNCYNQTSAGACQATPAVLTGSVFNGTSCVSQGMVTNLVARSYAGVGGTTNISCQVGPIAFTATDPAVVTISPLTNGQATAAQPGTTTINAATSQASSTAGFFSTCAPASITLAQVGSSTAPTGPITVDQNVAQALSATVIDTAGNPITNITLEYESTTPQTIPSGSATITPLYPGAATITAICQPPTCNSAPLNEIGLALPASTATAGPPVGNGTTITSNPVLVNAIGSGVNTVLYIGSTQSQYLQPFDFTLPTQGAPIRLPYVPNSLALSEDQSTIYMGTPNEIMIFATGTNSLTKEDTTISGNVLTVSPDNGTVVITDPVRKLTYLYTSTGAITSEYGAVATRAAWSPDSQTVYITTNDGRLLVYSTFTGWTAVALGNTATDVAVTVPSAGAYLAEGSAGGLLDVRTNCPATTVSGTGIQTVTSNVFYPDAGSVAATPERLAATNDGVHILGANVTNFVDVTTNAKRGSCPVAFTSTPGTPLPLGVAATDVNNVLATTDSAFAFVTYQGTGGTLPEYTQSVPGGHGTITQVALQRTSNGTPVAAVSSTLSADNQVLYLGTSGDNIVHRLSRGATGFADALTPIVPLLPLATGATGVATPNLLVSRPKKPTS